MKARKQLPWQRPQRTKVETLYGKIGIAAVAAAVRYQGEAAKTAEAPADAQSRHVIED